MKFLVRILIFISVIFQGSNCILEIDKATLDLDPSCNAISRNFPFINGDDADDDNIDGPTVEACVDLAKKSCKFCLTY